MKRNRSIILGIIVTILVMLTLLGLTYAYYRTRVVGNTKEEKSINNPTKMLRVEYQDDNPEVITDKLYGPGKTLTKDFKVKNTGDDTGNYSIILDNIENTLERTWDIRYILKDKLTGKELVKGTLGKELKKQMVYADISIETGDTKEYTFELEYENPDEDQSIDMGKQISFKIDIIEAHENIFEDIAGENTLLYAIGRDNPVVKPKTIPGQQSSLEGEAELSYTEDDYGTSYYFRGNVENNYVTFANMCWRIVRILGNGSIKIILADSAHTCNDETYSAENTTSAFIKNVQAFNSQSNTKDKVKYKDSDIQEVINKWYQELISKKEHIDEETQWCMDTSETSTDDNGVINFGTYDRLYQSNSIENAIPSLKCNFTGENGTHSEKYVGEAALLSAEEVTLAGTVVLKEHNNNYYLNKNASGYWWWTMSPGRLQPAAMVFHVESSGSLGYHSVHYVAGAVRPSLVLKSNVTISKGGNGTQQNPYTLIET